MVDSPILAKSLSSGRRSLRSRENARDNTTDATRYHEAMWETSFSKVEPDEEPSSFNFISGNLELVDTSILQGDPG